MEDPPPTTPTPSPSPTPSSFVGTFQEVSAELIELRPGRLLFVKCIIVGDASAPPEQGMNVVCIHGTAANHTQYLPLWHAMHQQLLRLPAVPVPPTTPPSPPAPTTATPLEGNDNDNNNNNNTTTTTKQPPRSIRRMTVWLYDGIGCGESPIALPSHLEDYSNEAQAKDLYALLRTKVHTIPTTSTTSSTTTTPLPTILLGHSYGPTLMMNLLQRYPTLAAMAHIVGCIFVSTGVINGDNDSNNKNGDKHPLTTTPPTDECSPPPSPPSRRKKKSTNRTTNNNNDNTPLVNGGPAIFKLPIFVLQCLQPILSASFLRLGFAKATWADPIHGAALIQAARRDCNANNMHVVQYLYRNHDWLTSAEIQQALRVVQRPPPSTSTSISSTPTTATTTTTTTMTTIPTRTTAENIVINRILQLPRLVIHGAEDSIIPLSCGQYLANQLDMELVVMDHASHAILVEQPMAVAASIWTFVQEQVLPHVTERQQQQELVAVGQRRRR